jgi:hypothetical protein
MGALRRTGCVSSVFGSVATGGYYLLLSSLPFKGAFRLPIIDMRLDAGTD